MEKFKIHAGQMEVAVAALLNYRVYTIVPNVSWGLGVHECDMLAYKDGKFTEIEIKVSAQDLKKDFGKKHAHRSRIISRLYYAVPDWLWESHGHLIPNHCGVIVVSKNDHRFFASYKRVVKHEKNSEKVSDFILFNFMRLGCMRIWSLKIHNNRSKTKESIQTEDKKKIKELADKLKAIKKELKTEQQAYKSLTKKYFDLLGQSKK